MALISIAHPDFREELWQQAKDMKLLGAERKLKKTLHGVYPLKLEEVRVIDGEEITIRPAKPVDERRIQEHFYTLEKDDIVSRFFHEKSHFVRDEVEGVTQIDYIKDLTLIAVVGEFGFDQVVGIGEYLLDPNRNVAEVAFSVEDGLVFLGAGNGDPSCHQRDPEPVRDAFHGLCQVILKAGSRTGSFAFEAYTPSLGRSAVKIEVTAEVS